MWPYEKILPRTINVKVVGGIGNQLFCYFAGYSLARDLSFQLIVDVSDIRHKRAAHDVSIEDFDLPGKFVAENDIAVKNFLKRLFIRIFKVIPFFTYFSNSYQSTVIGFEPAVEDIRKPVRLNGYFQTYKYFDKYADEILPLKMKNQSDWFTSTLHELSVSDFISIHVRRGDYQQLSDNYGLLGKDYYKKALARLNQMSIFGRVVVFSDDITKAQELLRDVAPSDTYWIDPPKNTSPVESLILMSQAKANIIANSTYSWWGASLNTNKLAVIAPSKWFRGMEDPLDLYPIDWHLVESSWEN